MELLRHNRMLRSHCLESELDMNYTFKHNKNILKTHLRVPKNQHFGSQMNPLGGLVARLGSEHCKKHPAVTLLGHHLGSFWTHKKQIKIDVNFNEHQSPMFFDFKAVTDPHFESFLQQICTTLDL